MQGENRGHQKPSQGLNLNAKEWTGGEQPGINSAASHTPATRAASLNVQAQDFVPPGRAQRTPSLSFFSWILSARCNRAAKSVLDICTCNLCTITKWTAREALHALVAGQGYESQASLQHGSWSQRYQGRAPLQGIPTPQQVASGYRKDTHYQAYLEQPGPDIPYGTVRLYITCTASHR